MWLHQGEVMPDLLDKCCGDLTGSGEQERMVDILYLDMSKTFGTFVWIPVGASQRSC